jgi:cobalamin biosynthesis protein CobW
VITLPADTDAEAIIVIVGVIARDHGVLRAKGYVAVAGKPMRLLVQGVGTRVRAQFDRAWRADEDRVSRIVVIGERGIDHAAITAVLTG